MIVHGGREKNPVSFNLFLLKEGKMHHLFWLSILFFVTIISVVASLSKACEPAIYIDNLRC